MRGSLKPRMMVYPFLSALITVLNLLSLLSCLSVRKSSVINSPVSCLLEVRYYLGQKIIVYGNIDQSRKSDISIIVLYSINIKCALKMKEKS